MAVRQIDGAQGGQAAAPPAPLAHARGYTLSRLHLPARNARPILRRMALIVATWLVGALGVYALVGVVFALAFVTRGAGRIDPVARAGTWGFRLTIFPGVVALWPLLLRRWRAGGGEPPVECNAHRRAGGGNVQRRTFYVQRSSSESA